MGLLTFTSNGPSDYWGTASIPGDGHVLGVALGPAVTYPVVKYRTTFVDVALVEQHVVNVLRCVLPQHWFVLKNVEILGTQQPVMYFKITFI